MAARLPCTIARGSYFVEPVGPITVWIAGMRGVSTRGLQVDSTSSAMGAALCHGVAHIIEHNHIKQPPGKR